MVRTPKGGTGKKQTVKPDADADDSYIVFTNSKGKPKGDTNAKTNVPAKSGPAGAANTTGGATEAPKKPDTRTLIGGASWTGKLPVNLLSEHCQKQRWEKPEYTSVCFTSLPFVENIA